MQKSEPSIPAWLVCEDIFNKIKTELITQAMDTLEDAIKSKAIEINGTLVNLPDKPGDTEMHMFIINKLIDEKEKIIERYKNYINDDTTEKTANRIKQEERLKKFLLAIEQISMLMQYSHVFDAWMNDIAMQVTVKEPPDVIKATINKDESRHEVLNYVLRNKKMKEEQILTNDELEILKKSVN